MVKGKNSWLKAIINGDIPLDGIICIALTALLAIVLAVNGFMAIFRLAEFASWHLVSLSILSLLSMMYLDELPKDIYSGAKPLKNSEDDKEDEKF